ncbi:MAG: 2-oxoacid:acceptor oxidoreductase family protein [Deltaproteobacteria bacterium]|nr:2-oxoacid:acceptor oxidoreductase family protein [Deltaproteobacteria bacterium]MBW1936214.1 2-oxoacid:acceptor oxidoreductase family protein [Deltaproteobacteria bacterium]MBW1978042.1 2-oxoacid:acceptor oxidoreductase family protein [Deltaproteobacteria bacterium]MBW2045314.1 2-oxoacid:acceptor oxidoreductase family protein [Deltaproteobacteria bacterium]MBW2300526.1 2-oxoacid:acceptor oxidoreductase family protein [Deltaproteobacteria bacterium]
MERYRIVFSGSGGQGVITASIILAEAAAIYEGLNAVQSQSYGAEARGGSTRADVIISDREIRFPKVNQPNILVCLTQQAFNKFSGSIRPGGLLLTDSHFVQLERKVDARQVELPMYQSVIKAMDKPTALNMCMLGAMLSLVPLVKTESIMKVLNEKTPATFLGMNKDAFEIGRKLVVEAGIEPQELA